MNILSALTDWWINGISCVAANLLENPVFPSGTPKVKGSRFLITIWRKTKKKRKEIGQRFAGDHTALCLWRPNHTIPHCLKSTQVLEAVQLNQIARRRSKTHKTQELPPPPHWLLLKSHENIALKHRKGTKQDPTSTSHQYSWATNYIRYSLEKPHFHHWSKQDTTLGGSALWTTILL